MLASRSVDICSKKLIGDIHGISYEPFWVHIYKEHMMKKYKECPTTLHLDSTGSVVRKVNDKTVYFYALIAENEDGNSYPLGVMLANGHTTGTITYFLTRICEAFKTLFHTPLTPPLIVTDFSWALIHASLTSFAQSNIRDHLDRIWTEVITPEDVNPVSSTQFAMCTAHVAKNWSSLLKQHIRDKHVRKAYMWLLTKLAHCQNMTEVSKVFTDICRLAVSREPVEDIEMRVPSTSEEDEDEVNEEEAKEGEDQESSVRSCKGPLRDSTPFGKFFVRLEENVAQIVNQDSEITNKFYAPDLIKKLQTALLPLLPFWTLVTSRSERLPSNAVVESFFKTVKENLLCGRTGLAAGDFTRLIMSDFASRVKNDIMQEKEKQSKTRSRKQKGSRPRPGVEEASAKKQGLPKTKERRENGKRNREDDVDEEHWGPKKKHRSYRQRKMPNLLKDLSQSRKQAPQTQAEQEKRPGTPDDCRQDEHAEQENERLDAPKDSRMETVVVSNIVVNHTSMSTLDDNEWLDDCVMDAYMLVAAEKSKNVKVWTFSVHVLRQMAQMSATRELKQEMQARYDGIESALWLVPFNVSNYHGPRHWVMFVVSLAAQRIVYVDYLAHRNPPAEALEHVMALVGVCRGPKTWAGWKLVIPDEQVKQQDWTSCGVLICHAAASTCQSNSPETVPSSPAEQSQFVQAYRKEMKQRLVQVSV